MSVTRRFFLSAAAGLASFSSCGKVCWGMGRQETDKSAVRRKAEQALAFTPQGEDRTMDSDWSVHPGIGLGRLKFGMTPEDVKALEGIYGKVDREEKTTLPSVEEQKIWKESMERQDPEIKKKWKEMDWILVSLQEKESMQYLESGLQLSYYERKLYKIFPTNSCKQLNINGLPVYYSEPKSVILALAKLLQENPLVERSDLVFRDSLVDTYGFVSGVGDNGKLLYFTLDEAEKDDEDTDFRDRGIAWSTLPRRLTFEDWSEHVEIKLL